MPTGDEHLHNERDSKIGWVYTESPTPAILSPLTQQRG